MLERSGVISVHEVGEPQPRSARCIAAHSPHAAVLGLSNGQCVGGLDLGGKRPDLLCKFQHLAGRWWFRRKHVQQIRHRIERCADDVAISANQAITIGQRRAFVSSFVHGALQE